VLAHGADVVLGHGVLHELLQDVLAPDARVDHLLRHLALTEAGDLHLASHLAVGAVEILRDLVRLDLHGQAHDVLVGLLDGGLHP